MKGKLIAILGVAFLLLSSCTPAQPAATATALPPTSAPPAPTATIAPPPTAEPTAVEAAGDQCLACHTDKQKLIDTAKIEEVVESESEGVG